MVVLIEENKWCVMWYGVYGKLIDFGKCEEVSFGYLLDELLKFFDLVLDDLGLRSEAEYCFKILVEGIFVDWQLRVFEESGGNF